MPKTGLADISRRNLILATASLPFARHSWAQGGRVAVSLAILLEGVDPHTPVATLGHIVSAFSERGIPVTVAIGPEMPAELVGGLAALQRREPWLVECAGVLEIEPDLPRYFVLRKASDLRADLARRGWPKGAAMTTCILGLPAARVNPYALRAAGFRVRIAEAMPEQQAACVCNQPDWGQINISGSISAALSDTPSQAVSLDGGQSLFLRLSLQASNGVEDATRWAEMIEEMALAGDVFPARPSDFLYFAGTGVSSNLGLLVDPEGATGADNPVAEFLATLQEHDVAYSLGSPGNLDTGAEDIGVCGPPTEVTAKSALQHCAFVEGGPAQIFPADTRTLLVFPESLDGWTGQLPDGRFQIALENWSESPLPERLELDPLSDRALLIRAGDLQTPIQRRTILEQLLSATRAGKVHVRSIDGYIEAILSPDPQLRRLWHIRERFSRGRFRAGIPTSRERDERIADAATAWAFIARHSAPETGLCAGTVQWGEAGRIDHNITFWDIGSQIQGIHAANRLGLLQRSDAAERIATILANLPSIEADGLRLPPAVFDGRTLAAESADFDSCDTGRFLAVLDLVAKDGLVTPGDAARLVDQWDFRGAIRNGRIHDRLDGYWRDATRSQCNSYAARGFGSWGIEIARAYPPLRPGFTADDQMRLFYSVGDIGHYGTEPILLDLVETGGEAASQVLADVLFDAQLDWFQTTGKLKCVSESPVNFPPWFVYQGLRLDQSETDAWVIRSKLSRPDYQSPAFRAKAVILISKSAYLWQAVYPHPYSELLMTMIRKKARIDGQGFTVGLFAQDLEPMQDYADVNTNGIILSALDYMMRNS